MKRPGAPLICMALLAGLLAHSYWRAFDRGRSHQKEIESIYNDVRDLGSMNARLDIHRGSMYYYGHGMTSSESDDALRRELSEYGVFPVGLGCQVFPVNSEYTRAYNKLALAHLIETHGKNPIAAFYERQKANSSVKK